MKQLLESDTDAQLHGERIITVREEPSLHMNPTKRDVSKWNTAVSRSSRLYALNVQEVRAGTGKNTHNEIRDVDLNVLCFVQLRGAAHNRLYLSCVARTGSVPCVFVILDCNSLAHLYVLKPELTQLALVQPERHIFSRW